MFQKKIVEKYLSKLDKELLEQKYDLFCSIFKNEKKIENIRNSKEEQYQEGFIRDLFVSVLGYTIKPEENYNILTELKNEVANKSNSKKSDGAICEENNENKIRAVIELKGTDTTDLDKVAFQAFSYKNFHNECNYVIVSNFERLRIYVETQIEFEEFNLFALSFERFCILYLLLELNQLKADIPLRLKHETLSEEKQITDNFYADYSTFKRLLFEDLCENNLQSEECHADSENRHAELVSASDDEIPNQVRNDDGKINKLLLFKKTQKLLDRILFILFCEDRNLLPPNSVLGIISDYQKLKEMGYGQPLYNVFKTYFDRIDKGYKNESDSSKNVFAYNGGLFKTDEVLDNIKVGDHVLYIHSKRLADYDFESQISVDILGRIFENSLTEIEEVQKEIEAEKTGEKVENNNVGKRKKDGVFYTPEYITKYIVENTIGKLCEEKREELKINDEEFSPEKNVKTGDDKKTVATKQKITAELDKRLETYRAWLLDLKILDPACGSGAFLNAALQQLKIEHTLIDYYWSNIHAGELNFTEIENTILENNLYGVDINEESVEIAKLSLWLHTAKKNRKLTTLNGKIKCGNSLIDDPTVAGEKAFNWEEEFPEVFAKGGFDVVIGNPPYVRADSEGNNLKFREYMTSCGKWTTLGGKWDLYIPFLELSIKVSKKNGVCSLIIPDAYCHAEYSKKSIDFMTQNKYLYMIDYFPDIEVFENVGVKSVIVSFDKSKTNLFKQRIHLTISSYSEKVSESYPQSFRIDSKQSLMSKLKEAVTLNNICYVSVGIVGNSDEKYYKGEFEVSELLSNLKDDIHSKLYYEGKNIGKWYLQEKRFIEYGTERSPAKWRRKGFTELFEGSPKIVTMRSPGKCPRSFLDKENGYFNESAIGFKFWNNLKGIENNSLAKSYESDEQRSSFEELSANYSYSFILAILNSSLVQYELNSNRRSNIHVYPEDWKVLPIPDLTDSQFSTINSQLTSLADKMLTLNETLQKKSTNFLKVVKQTFALEKISTKLETFYNLDFDGFLKELKQKVTPKTKLEWLEVFEETKKELQDLKQQIDSTDKEINRLVYKLYGLTEEEIKIVEGR